MRIALFSFSRLLFLLGLAFSLWQTHPATAALTYYENGDAGQTLPTASPTDPAGQLLDTIFGTISTVSDVDLFAVYVPPNSMTVFSAYSGRFNQTQFNPKLFLFDAAGRPVFSDDDYLVDPSGNHPPDLDATLSGTILPGLYYLGISFGGALAVDANGTDLFDDPPGNTVGQNGPNPATSLALAGWVTPSDPGLPGGTGYAIDLYQSVESIPEPSALAFGTAGVVATLCAWARRRKLN